MDFDGQQVKPSLKSSEDIIPLDEESEPRNNQDDKLIEDAARKSGGMLFPWFMRWRQVIRSSIGMAAWERWIQNKYRNQPSRFLHWVAFLLSLSILAGGITIFLWQGTRYKRLLQMEDFPTVTKDVLESVNRVQEIVDGLKDFSRIKETSFQGEDTVDVLQNALKFSKLDPFLNHNVSIQTQFESNLPKIHINKREIEQVFVNLFTNAAHALEAAHDGTKNPILKITAMRHESEVRIIVADNGTGMSAEVKEKIFNPFFTTKHDTGKGSKGRGTGLGLSICHGIIDKHRGSITVESEVGVGSVFTVFLPINPLDKDRRVKGKKTMGGMRMEDRSGQA